MTHVRTQMREAFKTVLDDALPSSEYVVFSSRKSALNHVKTRATVDMRFQNDQTRQGETMRRRDTYARVHVASLYIRVQCSASEETIDNVLDAHEVRIVEAIEAHDWDELLEREPELVQTNFSDDGSTGRILGAIVLRYDLEYRIDKNNPEQIIE